MTKDIRNILRHCWNPIGIDDLPEDEYDIYIEQIQTIITTDKTPKQTLTNYLRAIDKDIRNITPPDELENITQQLLHLK